MPCLRLLVTPPLPETLNTMHVTDCRYLTSSTNVSLALAHCLRTLAVLTLEYIIHVLHFKALFLRKHFSSAIFALLDPSFTSAVLLVFIIETYLEPHLLSFSTLFGHISLGQQTRAVLFTSAYTQSLFQFPIYYVCLVLMSNH